MTHDDLRAAVRDPAARDSRHQERFAVFLADGSAPIDPTEAPPGTTPRPAAVLVIVFQRDDASHLLLTRRPEHLAQHGGQISFPGGSRDPADDSLRETALRETHEELGLARDALEVIGELGAVYVPPTNFHVTPFVALHDGVPDCVPNEGEVAEVLEVPLALFLAESNVRREQWQLRGKPYLVPHFSYRDPAGREHAIWGATARMISMLVAALPKR